MEAFESFVALALEAEDFVVTGPVKFMINMKTKKKSKDEFQTHGYEVDLVAARADKLILASVKGFFGSGGVRPKEVTGSGSGYKMLNNVALRNALVKLAAEKFGYRENQVEMRLYGGKFYQDAKGLQAVRDWAAREKVGSGPIEVFSGNEIAAVVVKMAESKTYRDHEIIMTIKALAEANMLGLEAPKKESFTSVNPRDPKAQSRSSKNHLPLQSVVEQLPVGSRVRSNKDGLEGVVLKHKQDPGKGAYVTIWVDGANKAQLRSASTLTVVGR